MPGKRASGNERRTEARAHDTTQSVDAYALAADSATGQTFAIFATHVLEGWAQLGIDIIN